MQQPNLDSEALRQLRPTCDRLMAVRKTLLKLLFELTDNDEEEFARFRDLDRSIAELMPVIVRGKNGCDCVRTGDFHEVGCPERTYYSSLANVAGDDDGTIAEVLDVFARGDKTAMVGGGAAPLVELERAP